MKFAIEHFNCSDKLILKWNFLGKSMKELKAEVNEKGDLGIVAEVKVL